ncbi:LOW QUALITY PROTEIN: interleukin-17 receptor A [Hyla sarda]|uniref:LOW QUALITY PROTEIN: interleukin-17 receptor A n=1 Tax=Hyla sarda TaxID=327740 RepID=UPI0024C409AE|nr:LOW QUALITY PROTEIN: interleukin-17 receptor A [Hyla sarda]
MALDTSPSSWACVIEKEEAQVVHVRPMSLRGDCMDLSWIQPYKWTPTAPSHLEVTAGIGLNEEGHRVPVLQINWTVSIDSSILNLQGAEISVLELGSNRIRCVQFQFGNQFPRQRDQNNQPWKFFYNRFEVNPGNEYQISVQHLPKQEDVNRRELEFTVPGCNEEDMTRTDTCCNHGQCWNHNITLERIEDNLTVTFIPQLDAQSYGVQVNVRHKTSPLFFEKIDLSQGTGTERRTVVFHDPMQHNECWYNVTVWPYMPSCNNDCVRQWYAPKCPPSPSPPPPDLSRQVKMWPIAAAAMIMAFAITVILLCLQACIIQSDPKLPIHPRPFKPQLVQQKVWLVYSADHKHYVDVVIRLADFLRASWGLEVVLDLHHSLDISKKGPMDWLVYQKEQIDETNGIILILCSKGAQAKWRAKQMGQEAQSASGDDIGSENWDLFTMALHLFCTDFQRSSPYGRYVVAYFSELSDVGDIPSPFEMCSQCVLTENLQDLLFRIQRIERHQPNVQYNVDVEGTSYRHLVKAVERCRTWQETHSDSPVEVKEDESVEEQKEVEEEDRPELTRRNYPQIRQPEASVSKMNPIVIEPDPIRSLNPSLANGPSSFCVVPLLSVEHSAVNIQQPSLNTEYRASYRQQPFLTQVDESLPIYNEHLHQIDLSIPSDQGVQSEELREAQIRLFSQSILGDQHINPDMAIYDADASPSSEDPNVAQLVGLKEPLLVVSDQSVPSDQGARPVDLIEAQKLLFYQSSLEDGTTSAVFDDESLYGSAYCLGEEDESVYEPMGLSIPHGQDIRPEDLVEVQKKFFLQTFLDDQNLPPDLFFDAESPNCPLMMNADIPQLTFSEPGLQIETSRPNGQGFQPVGLREALKNWFPHSILGDPRRTPEMDALADEINIYEDSNGPELAVMGQKNNRKYYSVDLGYGSLKQ